MIIAESNIGLSAERAASQRHERHESLNVWVGERSAANVTTNRSVETRESAPVAVPVNLSHIGGKLQPQPAVVTEATIEPMSASADLQIQVLKMLVELFTGHRIELMNPADLEVPDGQVVDDIAAAEQVNGDEPVGWGMVYDYYEAYYEAESVSFNAQGMVQTADGSKINIDLQLNMSRRFVREQHINITAGDAVRMKDPLIVNFNGTAAELTQTKFKFDIDADGNKDQIAFVGSGSGFLALDRNDDGVINDGRELFGAISGQGFSELTEHDQDDNGWIDEADSIYEQLRIWSRDTEGNDQLVALGQRGVGAIYLGHIETPFLLKDSENMTHGQIRESGVFLGESGEVGTVQQLDLVV
ncbi:MAG: hypothetical protein GY696_02685 [Gammaproteobacteria bacterium]|nr:hypothetical protein [Gammaproteobacteria bacterium]